MNSSWKNQPSPSVSDSPIGTIGRDCAEDGFRDAESRFRLLAELTGQISYDRDIASGRVSWDGAVARLTGFTSKDLLAVDDEAWREMIHPDDRLPRDRALEKAREKRRPYVVRYRLRRKDGDYAHVEDRGTFMLDEGGQVERMLGSIADVGERWELEQQLVQAQKMESIGRLAGGVAHDFNNIINIIIAYSERALRQCGSDTTEARSLEQILKAAERAAALTRQLLAFARKEVVRPRITSLNGIIKDVESMLRRLLGEDVALETDLDPSLENVLVDPGQIHQVLMNLVANARDAMPGGGKLTIKTANVTMESDEAHPDARRRVLLRVSDDGHGMPPEVLRRAFEPFFTTKAEGTGLGLATVHGIVRRCKGAITVESASGAGTTFSIGFPPATEEAIPQNASEAPSADGSETILLVEDDVVLLQIMKEGLELRGYTVLAAEDGEEAVELSRKHTGAIELLLTDVIMPGMSGHELARRLLIERPKLRALFISGYTADFIARRNLRVEEMDLLAKPFSEDVLQARIRATLDQAGA
jgi:two-component system cell cycle sensor histidine kinase/response regulator CckA